MDSFECPKIQLCCVVHGSQLYIVSQNEYELSVNHGAPYTASCPKCRKRGVITYVKDYEYTARAASNPFGNVEINSNATSSDLWNRIYNRNAAISETLLRAVLIDLHLRVLYFERLSTPPSKNPSNRTPDASARMGHAPSCRHYFAAPIAIGPNYCGECGGYIGK